jgi:hypothetical protein
MFGNADNHLTHPTESYRTQDCSINYHTAEKLRSYGGPVKIMFINKTQPMLPKHRQQSDSGSLPCELWCTYLHVNTGSYVFINMHTMAWCARRNTGSYAHLHKRNLYEPVLHPNLQELGLLARSGPRVSWTGPSISAMVSLSSVFLVGGN